MASLRKRLKSDNWVCCYATADGRRAQRSTGTTDKNEAMAICRRWENEEYALRGNNGEPVEGLAVANKRALVAGLVSMVIVILSLVGFWQYDLWKNGPELFVDVPESERPATFAESNLAKRHRWVKLSPDALERLNTLGGKIRLNLFDDLQVSTEVEVRRFINGGAETSVGRLDNDPDTLMMVCRKTVQPGKLMGVVVDTFGTQYLISHEIDDKHVIVEVDQSKIPGCGGVVELEEAKQPVKTAAKKAGLPATQVARQDSPEAKALERLVRGSEAQALLDPSGHAHRAGATCRDCRSFAELKKQFKKVELKRTPKTGTSIPTQTRKGPSTEPVNTGSHNLLNSMGFNKPLLAAINPSNQSFGLWGRGGSARQSVGPTSPGILEHMRGGDTEYIDVLFIYTDDLLQLQTGADAGEKLDNLKLSITRTVELTNTIFSQCHIPLEVRTADITLARHRAMGGGDSILAQNGGPGGPAWVQTKAPVRPIWDNTLNNNAGGWEKHWGNGASVGQYQPLYTNYNPSKLTPPGELGDALGWIGSTDNSLIYSDQYWGSGTMASTPAEQVPYINLPSTTTWTIVPEYDDKQNNGDNGVMFTYDSTRTPELNTGPVEHPDSSHGLDDSYPVGSPTGIMGAVLSHMEVQQYNDITGPDSGPVLIDIGTDNIQWIGGPEHGLATGSVVYFESWGTAPDTAGGKLPKWKVHQQPQKKTKVKVAAAEGGSDGSGDGGGAPRPPGGGAAPQQPGSGNEEQRTDAIKGQVTYPIVAGLNGVITRAQHYPQITVGKGKTHPMIEMGRASYWFLDFPGNSAKPEETARAFLGAMAEQLKMKADTSDLQTLQVKHGLGTGHTRFQQTLHGVPIYGAHVSVHQGTDGAVDTLHTKYFSDLNVDPAIRPKISITAAKGAAYRKGGITRPRMPGSGKLVWWPDEHGSAKLAWEVTICALKPLGDFHTVVDAETGRVLLQENRICFASGSGNVFKPNPYQMNGGDVNGTLVDNPTGGFNSGQPDNNSTELDSLMTNVTLPRLRDGIGQISGTYSDMVILNSTSLPDNDAIEATRVYNYSRNNLQFEQPTIYYTIDRIANYFISIGFSSGNTPPNGIRDANATRSCSQWNTADQSFYSSVNNSLHFGTGGVDDGEDGDIVAHEYGHAIQHDQNINWGGGEMGAMGEAFSDYLAASIFANDGETVYQTYHAAAVGEWDAISYDTTFDNTPDVSKGYIKSIMGDGTQYIDNNSSALSNDVKLVNVGDFVLDSTGQKMWFTDNNGSFVRRMDYNSTFGTTVDVNSSITTIAGGGGATDPFAPGSGSAAPSTGLVAYYPFNGNANDESGSATVRNGTVNGATLTIDRFGLYGSAYSFDGVDDNVTATPVLADSTSITISTWVRMDSNASIDSNRTIFMDGDAAGGTFCMVRLRDGSCTFITKDNHTFDVNASSLVGAWHHLVCVADDASNLKQIWIDGTRVGEATGWAGTANVGNHANLVIGAGQDTNSTPFHLGSLDQVRVYSRALTAVEVGQLYTAENTLTALNVQLGTLGAIDVDSTGRVAFVDKNSSGGSRIRQINADGTMATIVGGGATDPLLMTAIDSFPGTPHNPATNYNFTNIDDIAFDDVNRLYLCDSIGKRIWRRETNGTIFTFAGGGLAETDGQAALSTNIDGVKSLATFNGGFLAGRFVYLDTNTTAQGVRIRRILADDNASLRSVTTVAGVGFGGNDVDANSSTPGWPFAATNVSLTDVDGIKVVSGPRVYFGDGDRQRVRVIDSTGIIGLIAGGGTTDNGDGNQSDKALLGPVQGIALDGEKQVYILGSTPLRGLRVRKCFGGPPIDPPNLRRVDGNKIYPDDLTGAIHADGEIWSRALWDIRAGIMASDVNGSQIADRIILQHHFAVPAFSSMRIAALAVYSADVSLYSGAHNATIRQAFNDRGITVDSDYSTGGTGINLTLNTDYYVQRISGTQFALHTSWIDAVKNQGKVDFNATGFNIQLVRSSVADVEYGQAYDIGSSAVVGTNGVDVGGLRMDISGGFGQRYSNLHGAYGDFGMDAITSRADVVCILTEPVGGAAAGLAQKYTNRGSTPERDLISGTTRADDVDYNSTEVLSNRDSVRNLSLQGQYLSGGYTFQHELGHVLGAHHGLGDVGAGSGPATPGLHPHDQGITFSPYAYTNSNGVADTFLAVGNHFMSWGSQGFGVKYCTIMAYTSTRGSTQIPLYSSPVAFYRGEPTGRLRGMYLPPPLSPYSLPLYMDNAQCINAVGHLSAFYRDSNGSGRPSSRTSVRPSPPKGLPGERPVNYSRNPNQANAKGGNSGTAAAGAPTQVGPGGATNPGGGLGGANNPTTNTNRPGIPIGGGSNPTLPVIPGGGLGGTNNNPGGGLGTNPTMPVLPINPAVPNDHRYSATKWLGGRWAKNNTTFATVINGHNNGATHENTERTHPAFHGKSVWWYIEWPANAPAITLKQLEASTKGSIFDTTLGVMYVPKGQLATQVPLNNQYFKWNNNAPGGVGPFSTVVLPQVKLNPGDRVYFMVDGVGGVTGKIRLGVKMEK